MRESDSIREGRNVVLEALRQQIPVDRLFVQEGRLSGNLETVVREAKKQKIDIKFVSKDRLDGISETGKHQGVIAYISQWQYSQLSDVLNNASEKNEDPFLFVLDGITDPHNLGAIIRTANTVGAHGVIIKKHGAAGLTSACAKSSAGAIFYTPVVRVTNISKTIEELKKHGLWFVCADMDGSSYYDLDLTGPLAIVIGDEGKGISDLVKKKCDYVASIPVRGEIESLNASVAAGVMSYEVLRQRNAAIV